MGDPARLADSEPCVVIATIGASHMSVFGPFESQDAARRVEAYLAGIVRYRRARFLVKPLHLLNERARRPPLSS